MMGAGQKVLLISGTRASTGDQGKLKGAWMPESVRARSGCLKLGGDSNFAVISVVCCAALPGPVFVRLVQWVSGPDLDRLILGNYIAADQRAGMRQVPLGSESQYRECGACYPKKLWGYGVGLIT